MTTEPESSDGGKILQISASKDNVYALTKDGHVLMSVNGNYNSVAWVDITPKTDARVLENVTYTRPFGG